MQKCLAASYFRVFWCIIHVTPLPFLRNNFGGIDEMRKAVVLLPIAIATFASFVYTQPENPRTKPERTPPPTSSAPAPTAATVSLCPKISIQPQGGGPIRDGQTVGFNANINGGDPKVSPIISWNVSAGMIKDGHGTPRIEVDSTGAGASSDRQIIADILIGGYAPECTLQASATVRIIPPAVKFGEFGELDAKTLSENLKALAAFLSQSPDNLYLIGYAGRKSERGFTAASIRRMKEELITEGVSARRIAAIDGGFREEPLFDFWIVPLGAEPPRAAPTVNRNEIVYPRSTPTKRP